MMCSGIKTKACVSSTTVNDDLVKDCLSVLYNCCICVSILFHTFLLLLLSNGPFVMLPRAVHVVRNVQMLFPKQTEGVTKSLAARDDFVLFLFTLMTNKKTFLQTATLIEDILGVKKVRVVRVFIRQREHLNAVQGTDLVSL